jgi:hypothetical protein
MFNSRLICAVLTLMVLASACGPARLEPFTPEPLPSPAAPQPLPSPADSWIMTLTQSGGLAGVSLNVTVSSDGQLTAVDQRSGRTVTQSLPSETVVKLADMYSAIALITPTVGHSNCADCFTYTLRVSSGSRVVDVKADDTTLDASGAADLVRLLRQLRDEALKSQP